MIISAILLSSLLIGAIGAWIIDRFGPGLGLIANPNERSSHSNPIPQGGGIGILAAFIVGAIYCEISWTLWMPACIVSLVSLLADFRDISYKIRFAVQVGAAGLFSCSIFFDKSTSESSVGIIILLFAFMILFITATANYFNFMDGINGIAGVTGIIAFTCLGLYGIAIRKEINSAYIAFSIAAACLGFLPLNYPKAKVFMGDVGSVLLGFLFASWVLLYSRSIPDFIFLASFLFPFYIDEISTLIIRILNGDKLTKAHRRHIYQILANQAGLSHTKVTIIYGIIQILVIYLAWYAKEKGLVYLIGLLVVFSSSYFVFGLRIRQKWGSRSIAA